MAIFAPHSCQFCLLKHCYCTAISMLLTLNVMHFAVQKRAFSSVILMLLGHNCEFFSQELTFMLPVSLLLLSRSPIHYGWFYCHLFGQKRHPVFSWMADDSSIIFTPNPKRDGGAAYELLVILPRLCAWCHPINSGDTGRGADRWAALWAFFSIHKWYSLRYSIMVEEVIF